MPFSHTVYRCYLQVVWYQATVCKPWPPFFQKVVTKVSPRNTRSQSNMTIIWACHCCSKILVLILLLTLFIHYVSSVWFHCFDGFDFDCTQRLFYTHANKVWEVYCVGEWGGVILNHPVPLSICLSEDEKFPDLNFETPVWFHLKINPDIVLLFSPS